MIANQIVHFTRFERTTDGRGFWTTFTLFNPDDPTQIEKNVTTLMPTDNPLAQMIEPGQFFLATIDQPQKKGASFMSLEPINQKSHPGAPWAVLEAGLRSAAGSASLAASKWAADSSPASEGRQSARQGPKPLSPTQQATG